ncbi:u4/u6 small nuclear ribonucleoprotein prp4 [Anaeramoeba flamelloides]|uniref:U4/u6 small nuclear ribonucleoprotein prp4 n=1 Tax=Anaeramoeba flamelloides TaxID=1746091 RepID=A0ABQ8YN41_9EUKA|nr:u4/u6 small nuclear ribonucleoprotein prp4 [Anaeramoeba flamelloides]
MFADDLILIIKGDKQHLNQKLNSIYEIIIQFGLKPNKEKTVISKDLKKIKYLGIYLDKISHIVYNLKKAKETFNNCKQLFNNNSLNNSFKIRLFKSFILSQLTYGLEIFNYKIKTLNYLNSWMNTAITEICKINRNTPILIYKTEFKIENMEVIENIDHFLWVCPSYENNRLQFLNKLNEKNLYELILNHNSLLLFSLVNNREIYDFTLKFLKGNLSIRATRVLSTERKKMRSNLRKKRIELPKIQQFKQKYINKNALGEGEHCIKSLDTIENIPNIAISLGKGGETTVSDYSSSRILVKTKKKSENACLLVHPTNSLFLLGTNSGNLEFYNYNIDKSVKEPTVCEPNSTIPISKPSPIMRMSLHPDKKTLLTSSKNNMFQLSDLETQKKISNHTLNNYDQITSSCIHPDGILFLFGTHKGKIHLWDVRSEQISLTLSNNKETQVDQIVSSYFGIHLGSVTSDSLVNIWDLREQRVLKTFGNVENNKSKTSIDFDQTGSHLCIGNLDQIQIIETKNWDVIKELNCIDKSSSIQDISWGNNDGIIIGTSNGVIEYFSLS